MSSGDTDLCVADRRIDEGDRAHSLAPCIRIYGRHVQTGAAIVNADRFIRPAPIPNLINGSHCVVKCEVSHGELLVTERGCIEPTIENEIIHETTGS